MVNRDRRIAHNRTYYNLEMLSRSGYDYVDVEPLNYYPSMFGNGFYRRCRVGYNSVPYVSPNYFISFYSNANESFDATSQTVLNQDYLLPVTINGQQFYSAPLAVNASNTWQAISGLAVTVNGLSSGAVQQPQITVSYAGPITNATTAPLVARDVTKYGFTELVS